MAHRGLLDAQRVAKIRSGRGNLDLANDLVTLLALFSMSWESLAGRTAATEEEVARAAALGPDLLHAFMTRSNANVLNRSQQEDQRTRAATLFLRAYSQC